MPTETILQVPVFSDLANLAFTLRREVFVTEQGVPAEGELDEYDMTADHYVLVRDGDVVATSRVIHKEEGCKLSRFAVRKAVRGLGVGGRMMAFVLADLKAKGKHRVFLSAQSDKIGFYEKYGFHAYGPEYYECDILHRMMQNWDDLSGAEA
ncbi:GNAT family N-acetyltransferase [Blastopirellula marina]|uniref:GNAT family N-acetyltransferase n=1 Tax=Blastopirellula marina TaxID=124 RepID=A0A2S8G3I3_9BACT|nr:MULTISPECIES: GNAT family N-acetyltransferase [Pirellulaceae]PQO39005.1 GNAT family N-acetyltransferase [Blastopirellula marina]RCS55313.1 GNAT family N-acetyltransferase [Bremerella cremea]